jgi:RNA polymerase sigma-70 factor (ECF subfamily)
MATGPENELLVLQAQAGDAHSFGLLVDRCHAAIVRHAARYLADRDLVRDAAQDAWCEIVRSLARLGDPARFLPWALCIAARRAIDLGRRRGRVPGAMRGDVPAEGVAACLPEPQQERGDAACLRAAMQRLASDQRVAVELHYLEGLPLPGVAEALGVPVGTVKSRLFAARQRLRAAMTRFQNKE